MGNIFTALTFPAGKLVYSTRQIETMTVGVDSFAVSPDPGKRWYLYDGYFTNNSGQAVDVELIITDGTNHIKHLVFETMADGDEMQFPHKEGTEDITLLGAGAYPILIAENMYLYGSWSALAGKAGFSYWYITLLEL
ncbi:unnamed protein product [marine sediment metagenome]|uniref:Uncharacterized protein n=1 Tax=marine sediment metagenome TaxID=412755 RepID=X1AIB8_9ZZZZ